MEATEPRSPLALMWRLSMRTSARNALRGVVERIELGQVNAEVILALPGGQSIAAVITRESVADLDLSPGREAIALIKSSFIILAADDGLRTSARNVLKGRVIHRDDGAINSEIALELAPGKTLTATITRQSADDLGLTVGATARALIKASHVILAVE
jgi:molybdate transport system regulatory protein